MTKKTEGRPEAAPKTFSDNNHTDQIAAKQAAAKKKSNSDKAFWRRVEAELRLLALAGSGAGWNPTRHPNLAKLIAIAAGRPRGGRAAIIRGRKCYVEFTSFARVSVKVGNGRPVSSSFGYVEKVRRP